MLLTYEREREREREEKRERGEERERERGRERESERGREIICTRHVLIFKILTLHIECPTATVLNDVFSFTFDKAFGFGIVAR